MAYSIGQVATQTGISVTTLRYYDKKGLLPFVNRTESGQRTFSDHDLEFMEVILCLKETGMSLAEIRHFVDLCMAGDRTLAERLQMFKAQAVAVTEQINELQRYLKKISGKMAFYELACEAGTESAVLGDCDHVETLHLRKEA